MSSHLDAKGDDGMNFMEIAETRQSCRNFDPARAVEEEKIARILEVARLAPSACNNQPYHLTVCTGEMAKQVAKATQSMGMNKFADEAPVQIVISEKPYGKTAALGARLTHNDYRSIDIGIMTAYLTAEATVQGLDTCILGWLDGKKLQELCELDGTVRLVISLGYADPEDELRPKKRREMEQLVTRK